MSICLTPEGAEILLKHTFPGSRLIRWPERENSLRHVHFDKLALAGIAATSTAILDNVVVVNFSWLDDEDGHLVWCGVCSGCDTVWYWGR